jgi:hypothetical protein
MFNIGASRQHSSSTSTSQGTSSSFGISEAASDAQSLDRAESGSRGRSSVFGADIFSRLFGGAANVAGQIATGGITDAAAGLFDSGLGFMAELEAMSTGGPAGAGEAELARRLEGGDSLLNDQIAAIQGDLETFFNETVVPGIRRDAIGAGAMGGDREGVALGTAGRGLVSEFAKSVVALRSNDRMARDNAAATLAGIQANRRLGAAGTGVASLPALLGIQEAGSFAALQPFMMLSEILGGPTVLTDTDAFSTSEGSSVSKSRSSSLEGSESQSTSSSTSSSKGKSFSFGLGS